MLIKIRFYIKYVKSSVLHLNHVLMLWGHVLMVGSRIHLHSKIIEVHVAICMIVILYFILNVDSLDGSLL